jgi:hypothetical protein
MRAVNDNALLSIASRSSRVRRALECAFWMLAYGVAIGALWRGVLFAGPYLRSLG